MPRRKQVTRISGERMADLVRDRRPHLDAEPDPVVQTEPAARTDATTTSEQGDSWNATTGTPPPHSTTAVSGLGARYLTPERLAFLRGRIAENVSPSVCAATGPAVFAAIGAVPFNNHDTDRLHLSTLWPFAAWCYHRDGYFDPNRHLIDREIRTYVQTQLTHMKDGGRGSYASTLRRIARGDRVKATSKRRPSRPPHTDAEVQAFYAAAAHAGRHQFDAEVLLALTAGSGLGSDEITQALPAWVDAHVGYTVLRVPRRSKTGEFREFPVFGTTARVLRVAAETDGPYLFRPFYKARKNVIFDLTALLAKEHKVWSTFSASAARNYWLKQHLQAGKPFHIVCAMAGIGPGNHLPTDLVDHMPYPTLADMAAATQPTNRKK